MARGSQFRTGRVVTRAPQRRKVSWAVSVRDTGFTALAANTKVLDQVLDPNTLANVQARESTIVRVRGILTVRSDQASVLEQQIGALGFILVTDEAVAAGAASIPGPMAEGDNDGWFVWVPFGQDGINVTAGSFGRSYVIDSKAMRKFQGGLQLVIMVENQHATQGLEFFLSFRMLFKFA